MTGTIFRHLFPVDGPSLIDGRHLSNLFGLVVPVQRSIKHPHELKIHLSDYVLCLDVDFPATIHLPPAHGRRGKPLRFVDVGNKASRYPITLKPTWHGSRHERRKDRIINWPTEDLIMGVDGEIVTLWPFWDQTNHGWFVYPQPTGAGSTIVSDFPPLNPDQGTTWWNSTDGQLYVWTGRQWVAASCCDGGIAIGDEPPDQPLEGWLWWDRISKQLFIWSGREWIAASCCDAVNTQVSDKPPDQPLKGWQWWDSDSKQLFIWTGREWVAASCCDGAIAIGDKPPDQPLRGWLWWDTRSKQLFVWSGREWVAASCCDGAASSIGTSPPLNPVSGQLWWSSQDGKLYIWEGSAWVAAACCDSPAPLLFTTTHQGEASPTNVGPFLVNGQAPADAVLTVGANAPPGGVWQVPGTNVVDLLTTPLPSAYQILPTDDVLVFGDIDIPTTVTLPVSATTAPGKIVRALFNSIRADGTNTGSLTFVSGSGDLWFNRGDNAGLRNAPTITIAPPAGTFITGLSPFVFINYGTVGGLGWLIVNQGTPVTLSAPANQPLAGVVVPVIRLVAFASSGTYTPTRGLQYAIVECWGGGGGGGAAANNGCIGGGGGGASGSYSRKLLTAAQIGASQPVTVGAGGVGSTGANAPPNATGGSGTPSSFGTLCVAGQGAGGTDFDGGQRNGTPGVAFDSGPSDILAFGNAGGVASVVPLGVPVIGTAPTQFVVYGALGGSIIGGSVVTNPIINPGQWQIGSAAESVAAGGSGATSNQNNTGDFAAGGAGFAGFVLVTEFSF